MGVLTTLTAGDQKAPVEWLVRAIYRCEEELDYGSKGGAGSLLSCIH